MCFLSLHRKGSRKRHRILRWPASLQKDAGGKGKKNEESAPGKQGVNTDASPATETSDADSSDDDANSNDDDDDDETRTETEDNKAVQYADGYSGNALWYLERSKYSIIFSVLVGRNVTIGILKIAS